MADFIGINNLIAGEVKEIEEANGWMTVQTPFGLIRCPHEKRFRAGDRCRISVRPETASICGPTRGRTAEPMNRLSGIVSFASYIGNTIRYDIELDREKIFKVDVQNPWNRQPFPIDERVNVYFPIPITLGIPV